MNISQRFFEHEHAQLAHDIARVEQALQDAPHTAPVVGERELLVQLQRRLRMVDELHAFADTDDDALGELAARIIQVEAIHQRLMDAEDTLSDAWWDTLTDMQVLADLRVRLRHAIAKDFVPVR